MTIPTASGSEILQRGSIDAQSNDPTAFTFAMTGTLPTKGAETATVPANHIVTLLTVTFCERNNAAEELQFYLNDGVGDISLIKNYSLGGQETFVWNDKIVLLPGDKCIVSTVDAADVDIHYSYIIQNWS